jgi:hypothetical protein
MSGCTFARAATNSRLRLLAAPKPPIAGRAAAAARRPQARRAGPGPTQRWQPVFRRRIAAHYEAALSAADVLVLIIAAVARSESGTAVEALPRRNTEEAHRRSRRLAPVSLYSDGSCTRSGDAASISTPQALPACDAPAAAARRAASVVSRAAQTGPGTWAQLPLCAARTVGRGAMGRVMAPERSSYHLSAVAA